MKSPAALPFGDWEYGCCCQPGGHAAAFDGNVVVECFHVSADLLIPLLPEICDSESIPWPLPALISTREALRAPERSFVQYKTCF